MRLVKHDHAVARHLLADDGRDLGVEEVVVGVDDDVSLLDSPSTNRDRGKVRWM